MEAEAELQVVEDKVWQGSALTCGHRALTHIHFGQAFSCCTSAHGLGWSFSSPSVVEKPSPQHRDTSSAFTSTTFSEVAAEAGALRPLFILCSVRKVLKST